MITVAEALVVALTLVAVVAFVRSTSGPVHPAGLSHQAIPPATSPVAVATTTVPAAPSMATQVSEWWSGTGEPETSALMIDLKAVQQGAVAGAAPSVTCAGLSRDTAAAATAPPAPDTSIQREWQLTVSTSTRASAACEAGRATALAGDLQPALYTIRDLSAQIKPYLAGQVP